MKTRPEKNSFRMSNNFCRLQKILSFFPTSIIFRSHPSLPKLNEADLIMMVPPYHKLICCMHSEATHNNGNNNNDDDENKNNKKHQHDCLFAALKKLLRSAQIRQMMAPLLKINCCYTSFKSSFILGLGAGT